MKEKPQKEPQSEWMIMIEIVKLLGPLDQDQRVRIIRAVCILYDIQL